MAASLKERKKREERGNIEREERERERERRKKNQIKTD